MNNIVLTDAVGRVETLEYSTLTPDEVRVLRAYKTWLQRRGYREALYCQRCNASGAHDGCDAHVTNADILIRCRCRSVGHKEQGVN